MVVIHAPDKKPSVEIRGTIGRPVGLGFFALGISWLGDSNHFAGVYQKRPRKTGQIFVKMRHYYPPDTPTINKENWRAFFASGVEAWHALTPAEKLAYNRRKTPSRQSGFTRFMSEYLRE